MHPEDLTAGPQLRYSEYMDTLDIAMDHEVVVIGAGFSGIGAAIKLDEAGFRDFVVLEAGDGVGGAWHWNTYPGIAVDIPSFSYQFSFEKRSDWSRVYAPGTELKAYAEHCVDKYGVRDRIQLNTKVVGARFDEDAHAWHIQTANGEQITARYVVGATGVFSQPKPPEIEGLDSFAGTTMHTARWDHSVDLRGKRVGVIGTGASAIQLIPAIAPEVEQVTVFQRTPIWCLPKLDAPMSPRARRALRSVPGAELATRWASQAFVEVTFVLAAHFAGTVPEPHRPRRSHRSQNAPRGQGSRRAREAHAASTRSGASARASPMSTSPSSTGRTCCSKPPRLRRSRRDGRSHERRGRASSRRARPCNRVQGVRLREPAGIRDAGRGWC